VDCNISEDVRVCYVWGASGIKTLAEMQTSPRRSSWGVGAWGRGYLDSAMLQNLFG